MIHMNKWLSILSIFLQKQGNVYGYNLKGSDQASSKHKEETKKAEEILQKKFDKVFGERRTQRFTEQSTAVDNGDLVTDGYCWITENGKMCFDGGHFQSVSYQDDEIIVEEFIDGDKYTYSFENVEKLRLDYNSFSSEAEKNVKLAHAMSDTSFLDSYDRVKYDCKVEKNIGSFNMAKKERIITDADSSSVWRIGMFIVSVDSDMVPISILTPSDEDNDEEFEMLTSVSAVELFSSTIVGCDPEKDGGSSPDNSLETQDRFLQIAEAHDPSISEEEYFANNIAKRELGFMQWMTAKASNTQWCGPGTDNAKNPCPDPTKSFDFHADNACRRHDHGKKIVYVGAIPRLECYVDNQLLQAGGHNWAVNAAYGKWGATSVIGCHNYQSYNCWKKSRWWWKYTHCGKKWVVKYGPNRYSGAVKTAGYKAKPKNCPHDYLIPF